MRDRDATEKVDEGLQGPERCPGCVRIGGPQDDRSRQGIDRWGIICGRRRSHGPARQAVGRHGFISRQAAILPNDRSDG